MNKLEDTIIGLGGIGVIETIPTIIPAHQMDYPALVQTIVQVVIGLATLLGLFRKKRIYQP